MDINKILLVKHKGMDPPVFIIALLITFNINDIQDWIIFFLIDVVKLTELTLNGKICNLIQISFFIYSAYYFQLELFANKIII
jgi:hypothetical protein